MEAENGGVRIHAGGVDIVKEQRPQSGTLANQIPERAIEKEIRDFKPMPDRVQALGREVVAVVGSLANRAGPVHQCGLDTFAHFLFALIQDLVTDFLVGKPQIADHRNHPEPDRATEGKPQGAGIAKFFVPAERSLDRPMGQIAGGKDVSRQGAE